MPLPTELTTPPVTNMYLVTGSTPPTGDATNKEEGAVPVGVEDVGLHLGHCAGTEYITIPDRRKGSPGANPRGYP